MNTETNYTQPDTQHEPELETRDTSAAPALNPYLNGVFGKIAVNAKKATSNPREEMVARIRILAPMIIAKHNAKFVCAATIQAELKVETGAHFNANFLGDCLGGHGLNLPRVSKRTKMRYALHMADSSEEAKIEVQATLDALLPAERAALIVA